MGNRRRIGSVSDASCSWLGREGARGCGRPVEKIGRIELMLVRTIIYNKIETLDEGVKVPGY